jgi:hypothetical protein
MVAITRNYPITAEQLLAKFGFKVGGTLTLFGYRNWKNQSRLALVKRI